MGVSGWQSASRRFEAFGMGRSISSGEVHAARPVRPGHIGGQSHSGGFMALAIGNLLVSAVAR